MKLLLVVYFSAPVFLLILYVRPIVASNPGSVGNSISKITFPIIPDEKTTKKSSLGVPRIHNSESVTVPDKTEDKLNVSSSFIVKDDMSYNTTESDKTIYSTVITTRITESNSTVNNDMTNASSATNSTIMTNITDTQTENVNNTINSENTVNNGSVDEISQCPEMCQCPQYDQWSAFLVPYLRQQLGSVVENYTDQVMKHFLLGQFAISAESPKAVLGYLFERVRAEGNGRATVSLWWTRFGITGCILKPNTTFYLDAAAEARLFPQVNFKRAQIEIIAKTINNQTLDTGGNTPTEQLHGRLASHLLYNLTFLCKEGARVVVTKEASLYRYGRWSSTGCQVSTDDVLTLHRNWSLIELSVTNGDVMWLQNITMPEMKNNTIHGSTDDETNQSTTQFQNDTIFNNSVGFPSLKTGTVFPSIQEFTLINSSLSLQQLSQVLVWFQKAKQLTLKNNSLEDFNCSQLVPSPATWDALLLSFSGLTSVPACFLRKSLTSLDLSSNSISDISVLQFPRYVPSPKLDSLNLSDNNIRDVGIFADLNLTFLYLAGNKISFLNKLSFTRLPGLAVVDLSGNLLHKLDPGSFKSLIHLQYLHLEHNYLRQFDRTVSPLRLDIPLECKIYLSYNRFSHPPFQSQLYNPGSDFSVYATGNPFACDCAMSSYIDATKNSSLTARYADRSDMHCMYPPSLRGRLLNDIVFTDTCPVVSDCPAECTCTLNRNDSIVTVDCSTVVHFQFPRTFPKVHKLRLEFQSTNETQTQTSTTFQDNEYLHQVVSINASGRGLTRVPDFMCEALKQAEVLDLSHNRLQRIPACFQSRPQDWSVLEIRLAHNPWSCDCDAVYLSSWLADMLDGTAKKRVRVSDVGEVWCSADTGPGVLVAEWDSSHCSPISYLPWAVTLGVVLGLAAILGPLLYIYRLQAVVVIHHRFHIRPFTRVPHYNEEDFDHEALVVHGTSTAGIDWVLNVLLPRTRDTHHRICVPDRDFLLGSSLAEAYASSVARAKATLCLLSAEAARDEWWLYAFQLARAEHARHPHMKFLLVLLENADNGDVPEEVREFIKANTYLSVKDEWFWKKLFYYLPDPPKIILLK